jgi:2-phosphosulfolactate phosphatase
VDVRYTDLDGCGDAGGTVVVVDVLRAFTTAAHAFARGARDIVLVATVDEAFAWRERCPDVLVMGEVDGLVVPGFDLSNSPAEVATAAVVAGRRLVHRTSAGTQGVVRSLAAQRLVAASFVCAGATAQPPACWPPRRPPRSPSS